MVLTVCLLLMVESLKAQHGTASNGWRNIAMTLMVGSERYECFRQRVGETVRATRPYQPSVAHA